MPWIGELIIAYRPRLRLYSIDSALFTHDELRVFDLNALSYMYSGVSAHFSHALLACVIEACLLLINLGPLPATNSVFL